MGEKKCLTWKVPKKKRKEKEKSFQKGFLFIGFVAGPLVE